MPAPDNHRQRSVPPRALGLSLAALAVPVVGSFWAPEGLEEYRALLWLVALIPAFLLAYYRGWRGVATALAGGMATLSLTQAVATWVGRPLPEMLLGVVVAYVAIALGIGWLAEAFKRDVDEVEDLAFTDILTRLPNRRHARVFLENEFAAAERGQQLSVVLFDLDGFKRYNDTYGHQAGDEVLKSFSDLLAETTRKMDLSARFGGEEFLSILSRSDSEGAVIFADRVREGMKEIELDRGNITVSAGVAAYHPSMRSPDELLAAADHALYRAKRDGRDCVRLFGRSLLEETLEPDEAVLELEDPGESREYPRAPEEMGRSQPPLSLLPHQITGFGSGRRVLVVEDDVQVRELVASYLAKEGFSVDEAADVTDGIRQLRSEYDVVVTDLRLPGGSGNDLVSATKSRWPDTQVLVITGVKDSGVAAEALSAGADHYLYKPFGMSELRSLITDALSARKRALNARTDRRSRAPDEDADQEPTRQAREAVVRGALSLAEAVELRTPYLEGHGERVAAYAELLADAVDPGEEEIPRSSLRLACRLHDVGRVRIPAEIFSRPEELTPEEYAEVQEHPRIGRQILEPLTDDSVVHQVVTWHHERWDGTGYPDGLLGDAVPLAARVVALADALDAMASSRPYRGARSWDDLAAEVRENAGVQFDPGVVDAFEAAHDGLRELYESHRSPPSDG